MESEPTAPALLQRQTAVVDILPSTTGTQHIWYTYGRPELLVVSEWESCRSKKTEASTLDFWELSLSSIGLLSQNNWTTVSLEKNISVQNTSVFTATSSCFLANPVFL